MEFKEVLENRRSIRKYTKQAVEKEKVDAIIEAGLLAPSAHNTQPWQFIIVRDSIPEIVKLLKEEGEKHPEDESISKTADTISRGNTLILVYSDRLENPDFTLLSMGAMIENMLLKATDLGLGSLWIGNILKISRFGVFGNSYERLSDRLIETASQDEIALGKATMYTVLNGEKVEAIEVEITKKYKQSEADIKSFEFQITDLQALEKTGGIIQGMSGSPIVQNGKLIGAVTHVSAQNPSSGFGIYIEWMLKESD